MSFKAKQDMVETVVKSSRGMGTHDYNALASAFPASPIHSGDINDQSIKDLAQSLLLDGDVSDGGHTFGTFNRNYSENDVPVMDDVDTAAHNLPSPYVPNPSSPGPGSMNASDIPEPPAGFGQEPNDQFGSGVGSQLSPDQSSAAISSGQFQDLTLGKSPGST